MDETPWLRRLKRTASLLLILLALGLAVAALAGPVFGDRHGPNALVILLDRSASMGAAGLGEKDRLTMVKQDLMAALAGVPARVPATLVAFDVRPEVLVSAKSGRREVIHALEDVEPRPVADSPESTIQLARQLAAANPHTEVWLASDRVLGDSSWRIFRTGESAPNVGITAFDVQPLPLAGGRFFLVASLRWNGVGGDRAEAKLHAWLGGSPVSAARNVILEKDAESRQVFEVTGSGGQEVHLRVEWFGDALAADDEVRVSLPDWRPFVVQWISPSQSVDPFSELALRALGEDPSLEIIKSAPEEWPPEQPADVYLFDGWLPPEFPSQGAIIAMDPPGKTGPIALRRLAQPLPRYELRLTEEHHPILGGVQSGRIAIMQTGVIEPTVNLRPLWLAGADPVLAAGEIEGRRLAIGAFSVQKSESLPLSAAWPILLGNLVHWAADASRSQSAANVVKTGTLLDDGAGKVREVDTVRSWSAAGGISAGGAGLLSRQETSLELVNEATDSSRPQGHEGYWQVWVREGALLVAVLCLIVESVLFHRQQL